MALLKTVMPKSKVLKTTALPAHLKTLARDKSNRQTSNHSKKNSGVHKTSSFNDTLPK
jgi:hypothetical protein